MNAATTNPLHHLKRAVRWTLGHAVPRTAIASAARRGDVHSRLLVATSGADLPLEIFDEVRAAGPFTRAKFAHVTARQPVVRELLSSPDVRAGVEFGADGGPLGRLASWSAPTVLGPLNTPSLLVIEPPDHTRMRKLVVRVFSAKAVAGLRERTEQIADDLLDALERRQSAGEPVDLVESYCALLPVTVIAEVLGVPEHERERVLHYGTGAAPSLDLGLSWSRFKTVEDSLAAFDAWLDAHIELKRREPGEDLLTQLVAARDDDGVALTHRELKATAGLVLAAGFETTVNLLGNGIRLLHDHPDQLALLRERPEHWSTAVDEVLRLDPPVLMTGRTVARDTEVAGTRLRRGSVVTALLAAANRDPEVFEEPDAFRVDRANAGDHVSFSAGRHYCLGAALARMEGEVGLQRFFDRFPDVRLEPGAERRSTRILRGFDRLPARLAPASVGAA
jgi:cytochrome P450